MSAVQRPKAASLLTNLFVRVALLIAALVLVVGSLTFVTAQRLIDEVYDDQLIVGANVLRALMSDELAAGGRGATALEVDDALLSAEDQRAFNSYANWRMFRLWSGPRLVLHSDTGPREAGPPSVLGFRDVVDNGQTWRVYALRVPRHDVTVEVGERVSIRLVLVTGIALGLAIPLLVLIPGVAILLWLTLRGGLRTLRELLAEIGRRSTRDLSPLPLQAWPRDLHPLVQAINGLFRRVQRALAQERRFLDDAAHQLRTPLAAVKLQGQLIAQASDPQERQALTDDLLASVDRAAALANTLLVLARLEAEFQDLDGGGDLRAETVLAIADAAPLAARRGVELSFEAPDEMPAGAAVLLRLVASNLIDNAIRHSPEGAKVRVRLWTEPHSHILTVTDNGPGIAAAERSRVLERFYRARGATGEGAGLGLAIVAEAVRLLGGALSLMDRPDGERGLHARVQTPRS